MQKYFDVLKKCALFHGIEENNLSSLLTCLGARVLNFDKKEAIFYEGDPAKHLGIVLSGSAQIITDDYLGNRSIVSTIEPSDLFAESFACAEAESIPVDIIASSKCSVMLIDCGHIMYTCSNTCAFHQQMIFNLMKDLAQKNIRFHQKAEITGKRSTREKLLAYLSQEAKKNKAREFDIPFNRQELADYLEVERSGLSAEISRMVKEGIIENRKNHFVLADGR
ncbi:MAG: Crp/Fnr family transcriptional regulator [Clostridia bacterium]|nr:Crp/Fnr family transcriptional regulator [Clostridia bacterium]